MNIRSILVAVLLMPPSATLGQAPSISTVWPPGGPMGGKVQAQIEGGNLGPVNVVWVSGAGVKATLGKPNKDGNQLPLTLEIDANAQPGPREVRVLSPKGASSPGYVWVGTLPETAEVEPNDQPEKATPLDKLPVTAYGRINGAEDVDWFGFKAEAGDTFVFECCANRIYSPLDPFMELHDSAGHLLGSAMEGYDRDPRLVYTFKAAGIYKIEIRDTLYRGGGNFVYRLNIGKAPTVVGYFPPGGRRGTTLTLGINGVNVGDVKEFSIPLPADLAEFKRWWVAPETPNGRALPFAISADDFDQVNDRFPPSPASVVISALPVTLNGRITQPKEADSFEFPAEQNKPVLIDVHARGIGSRLDAYLRVLDRSGKELMNTEEQVGRDARVTFNPPSNGVYRLTVTSLDNKGGPDYYYRIALAAPGPPDYRLSVSPDLVSLNRNQSAALTVNANRRGGFNGAIDVAIEGLPAGVRASKLTIGPGQSTGFLTLTGAQDAPFDSAKIAIAGSAMIDGKTKRDRVAVPIANLPRPGEGQAVPRPVEFQAAAVQEGVPLFALALESEVAMLKPGQSVTLKVKALRRPNDNAANPVIGLSIQNLPPGVSAETPAIPEKAGEIAIKLTAAGDAKPYTSTALITGKLGDNNIQVAPGLVITVGAK